jgi:myo-inositol catabolism protein IolS
MRYRPVGRTDIKVSEVGFGCWTMGGPNWNIDSGMSVGWADVNMDELIAGIKAGIDGGVNHWDNADAYGNGRAERRLAAAFKKLGVKRDSQVIATKVGHFRGTAPYAYDPRHIRNQCEQSLKNLSSDYIDIYYFHHGTFVGPGYDGEPHDYLFEAAGVMRDLVKEGKVRAVGQSAYTEEDFEKAVPVIRPDVLQNKANLRYDQFIRPGSKTQHLMASHGCTFVAFGPLDQGILLDKFSADNPPKFGEGEYRANRKDFNPSTLAHVHVKLDKVRQRIEQRAKDSGVKYDSDTELFSSVATRWVLAHDRVCSAIPGFRNDKQAKMNLRAAVDGPLNSDDVEWCRRLFAE